MLLTTHDLDDIEELCRRIMIIDHGKVLYDGQLAQLKQQLLRTKQIKFVLKDRAQARGVGRAFTRGLNSSRSTNSPIASASIACVSRHPT